MATTTTEEKESAAPATSGRSQGAAAAPGVGNVASLRTDRGLTTIADLVVAKIAGIATREVRGVYDMGSTAARAFGMVTQRVGLIDERTQGVAVEVGEREAAVDLVIVVEYGESIPNVAEQIRSNVISRIEGTTGLSVTEVNVAVTDIHFPGEEASQSPRVS